MTHSDIDSKASSSFYTYLSRQWLPSAIQKHFRASKLISHLMPTVHFTRLTQSRHESESRSVMSDSLQPHGLYSPWNSPRQNTGVGSLSLLQGIFLTQGSNPGLPQCRQILYQLSHRGSPRILEQVAYPFSSGSSWPRNRTGVSCIAGRFFTNWATRETPKQAWCAFFISLVLIAF